MKLGDWHARHRKEYMKAVCPVCRREYEVMPSQHKGYCSHTCHAAARRMAAKASPAQ
jgi:hypothetical protein